MSDGTVQHGQVLHGQYLDKEHGITEGFTQEVQNCDYGGIVPAVGLANTEVIPIDANSSMVKTSLVGAANDAYLELFYSVAMTIDQIRLPDELISLKAVYTKSGGSGQDTGSGGGTGTTGSVSGSADSTSSGGITVDVQPHIQPHWGDNIPGQLCYFFSAGAASALSDILTRLAAELSATVNPWPVFHPETHSVTAVGDSVSLSTKSSAQQSVNSTGETHSKNQGKSIQHAPNLRTLDISQVLHRTIVVTDVGDSKTISSQADTAWSSFGGFSSMSAGLGSLTETALASVTPTRFSATSPANIPTTGLYLYNLRPQFFQNGLFLNIATVVDMAYFQAAPIDLTYATPAPTYVATIAIAPNSPDFSGGFPDSYAVQSGSLPTGLSLDTFSGIISGTPTTPTTYTVVIRGTNVKGHSDVTINFIITS